jgi:hypothetical protein
VSLKGHAWRLIGGLGVLLCKNGFRYGIVEGYLTMLVETTVASNRTLVLPLIREFIGGPDESEKQDCERHAAKRGLAA